MSWEGTLMNIEKNLERSVRQGSLRRESSGLRCGELTDFLSFSDWFVESYETWRKRGR